MNSTTVALLLAAALVAAPSAHAASLFSEENYVSKNPRVSAWWSVMPGDIAVIKGDAATFSGVLAPSGDFANTFVAAVGRGQAGQAARALGYLINGNMTIGGGCPAPPTPAAQAKVISALKASLNLSANTDALMSGARGVPAEQVADLNSADMNAANVSDAILGGLFMAARPCGPPNRLSSGSMEKVEAKYLESTCYYVGPILTALMADPEFSATFTADSAIATEVDNWVAGSIFRAFTRCVAGGADAQAPPSWLNRSFPAVQMAASQAVQAQSVAAGGRRLLRH